MLRRVFRSSQDSWTPVLYFVIKLCKRYSVYREIVVTLFLRNRGRPNNLHQAYIPFVTTVNYYSWWPTVPNAPGPRVIRIVLIKYWQWDSKKTSMSSAPQLRSTFISCMINFTVVFRPYFHFTEVFPKFLVIRFFFMWERYLLDLSSLGQMSEPPTLRRTHLL